VLGPALTRDSLADIRTPVRIIVGSADDQAIPDVNARPIAAAIPMAELEVLPNVTHYTFLARCTVFGRIVAQSLCSDPAGIGRGDVHARVSTDALEFFTRTLRTEEGGSETRR
jgi:predicted dienelactone hydrolase